MPVLQELSDHVLSDVAAAARYNHFHAAYLLKFCLVLALCSLFGGTQSRYMLLSTPSVGRFVPTIVRALPLDRASASEDFKRCPVLRLVARMETVSAANTK